MMVTPVYSVFTDTCCLSLLDPVPSYLGQVAIIGWDIKPTPCFRRLEFVFQFVCFFIVSSWSLRSMLASPIVASTCYSRAPLLVSSRPCSQLRLGDVFHCLSESHINTTSSAVAIGGREAAHTANNYIFPLPLLSSPRKSYSSSCQIFSHLTGGCADAGPGYPTLTVLLWKVQRWHGFHFNTSSHWPAGELAVFPPLSILSSG